MRISLKKFWIQILVNQLLAVLHLWILDYGGLLRAYGKITGDYALQERHSQGNVSLGSHKRVKQLHCHITKKGSITDLQIHIIVWLVMPKEAVFVFSIWWLMVFKRNT